MRPFVLFIPAIALAACGSHASAADGPQTSRSFPVAGFHAVDFSGSDTVHVVTGRRLGVSATGPSDVLDRLDIHVEDGRLKISRKRMDWHMGWSSSRGAIITVMTPGIDAAVLAGSGNLAIDHNNGDAFKGSLAGSGKLSLGDVRVAKLALDLAGSGNLSASGVAREASFSIGGSGNIAAPNLVSQTAKISVGGSGNVQLTVKSSAAISLAGSGNVTVTGTTNCQISKVGSGDARCLP